MSTNTQPVSPERLVEIEQRAATGEYVYYTDAGDDLDGQGDSDVRALLAHVRRTEQELTELENVMYQHVDAVRSAEGLATYLQAQLTDAEARVAQLEGENEELRKLKRQVFTAVLNATHAGATPKTEEP